MKCSQPTSALYSVEIPFPHLEPTLGLEHPRSGSCTSPLANQPSRWEEGAGREAGVEAACGPGKPNSSIALGPIDR